MEREIRQRTEVIYFTCVGCTATWKPQKRIIIAVLRREVKDQD